MFRYLLLPVLAAVQSAGQNQAQAPPADYLNEGKNAVAAHDYARAVEQFRAAIDNSDEAAITLDALRRLAAVSRLLGHSDEAERALLRAAAIAANLHGATSLELASVLSDLSGPQWALGKQQDALLSLESAIRMRELHPTEQLAELANDLLRTSAIRINLGETGPAKDLLTRALTACEKALPPESALCTCVLDALAGVLRDSSEYSEAGPLYVRLLRLREAAFGADSSELISTLDSLSYVYFGLQRYDDAQPVYERLLALWEASAGSDHPMIALTLDKMAEFFAAQERYAEAEPLVARAAAMRTRTLIESLKRSGRIQAAASKLEEAAEIYRRAVLIADESKIADAVVDPILRAYAGILRDLDRGTEAEAIERRIAAILARKVEREGRREAPVARPEGTDK
jgi:tetratricopeptide (TPR) repeat protein